MKTPRSLFVILAILILGLLAWRFWGLKTSKPDGYSGRNTAAVVTNASSPSSAGALPALKPNPAPPVYIDPSSTPTPEAVKNAFASGDKVQIGLAIMAVANSRRIDFYGKLVDQYNKPVPGVKVKGSALLVLGADRSSGNYYNTETDDQGNFSFVDAHGTGLGFIFEKEGYTFNYDQSHGWTKDYKPDPNNPTVFTMWKLQGPEPMVHAKIHDYIPCDGTEMHYDLLTGKRVATGGDLIVKLTRDPVNIVRGKPFNWQASIEIVNGGLLEIADAYPNEAPADGYKSKVTITQEATAKGWSGSYEPSLYFTARNGKVYGRIKVNMAASFQPPPTLFNVDIYANPAGSRNLEWDEAKQIKPGK